MRVGLARVPAPGQQVGPQLVDQGEGFAAVHVARPGLGGGGGVDLAVEHAGRMPVPAGEHLVAAMEHQRAVLAEPRAGAAQPLGRVPHAAPGARRHELRLGRLGVPPSDQLVALGVVLGPQRKLVLVLGAQQRLDVQPRVVARLERAELAQLVEVVIDLAELTERLDRAVRRQRRAGVGHVAAGVDRIVLGILVVVVDDLRAVDRIAQRRERVRRLIVGGFMIVSHGRSS
jgi:O-acetyl-ADP-ribose deacetylase (regulator of RNase III)